jgi:aspartate-semialdehyde dehydrogenase
MAKVRVALLGACGTTGFAWVTHTLMGDLENHPYFELVGLVAEKPEYEGRTFGECMEGWYEERPLKPEYRALKLLPPDGQVLRRDAGIGLVISSSLPDVSKRLDIQLAASGMPVVSESPGLRDVDDVPLIVPEINADHLAIIPQQKQHRGWKDGFIVSNPVCTITVLAVSLKPILDAFGIERVIVTTLQALSGAGRNGIPSMLMLDNLVPYIGTEEEKLFSEGSKIFGSLQDGRVAPASFPISATCTRVPVLDGHTGAMFVQCKKPVTVAEVAQVLRDFRSVPQELGLPSAARQPILVTDVPDRPQPRLDRNADGGKAITVGRIRLDAATPNGVKYVVVGHNRQRGTHGNTLLNAELVYKKGLLD